MCTSSSQPVYSLLHCWAGISHRAVASLLGLRLLVYCSVCPIARRLSDRTISLGRKEEAVSCLMTHPSGLPGPRYIGISLRPLFPVPPEDPHQRQAVVFLDPCVVAAYLKSYLHGTHAHSNKASFTESTLPETVLLQGRSPVSECLVPLSDASGPPSRRDCN